MRWDEIWFGRLCLCIENIEKETSMMLWYATILYVALEKVDMCYNRQCKNGETKSEWKGLLLSFATRQIT